MRHDPAALAAAGRRLAAIDPNRAGIGGLRFQLELAMFVPGAISSTDVAAVSSAPTPAAQRPATKPEAAGRPVTPSAEASAAATSMPPAETRPTRDKGSPAPIEPAATAHAATAPAPTPTPRSDKDDTIAPSPSPPEALVTSTPTAAPEAAAAPGPSGATSTPTEPTPTAVAATPRPVDPPQTPTAADPELEQLLAAWPAIVAQLSAHPPTKPLIVACRPVAVDGAIVTLGFPEEQAFLKDAAERRRPAIEAGISAALGHPVNVRCIVANVELPPAATEAADASFVLAEARRIFADDIVDVGEIS